MPRYWCRSQVRRRCRYRQIGRTRRERRAHPPAASVRAPQPRAAGRTDRRSAQRARREHEARWRPLLRIPAAMETRAVQPGSGCLASLRFGLAAMRGYPRHDGLEVGSLGEDRRALDDGPAGGMGSAESCQQGTRRVVVHALQPSPSPRAAPAASTAEAVLRTRFREDRRSPFGTPTTSRSQRPGRRHRRGDGPVTGARARPAVRRRRHRLEKNQRAGVRIHHIPPAANQPCPAATRGRSVGPFPRGRCAR